MRRFKNAQQANSPAQRAGPNAPISFPKTEDSLPDNSGIPLWNAPRQPFMLITPGSHKGAESVATAMSEIQKMTGVFLMPPFPRSL